MIDVEQLYIVNYSHNNCELLKNIMRLPEEQAFQLAAELARNNEGREAFWRFADFENYYPRRKDTDKILYESFVNLGGAPQNEHPLSFVLLGSNYLHKWFDNGIVTKIPLLNIPSNCISFTLGDSMSTLERIGKIEMISKEELLEMIRNHDGTLEEFMEKINEQHGYIEVQLWDDRYCIL